MTSQPPEGILGWARTSLWGLGTLGDEELSRRRLCPAVWPLHPFTKVPALLNDIFKGRYISYPIFWDKKHTHNPSPPSRPAVHFSRLGAPINCSTRGRACRSTAERAGLSDRPSPSLACEQSVTGAKPSPCFRQFLPKEKRKQRESGVPRLVGKTHLWMMKHVGFLYRWKTAKLLSPKSFPCYHSPAPCCFGSLGSEVHAGKVKFWPKETSLSPKVKSFFFFSPAEYYS